MYVICNDCDGKFQSPPDMDNSIQDSIKRLQTASLVWQSCMAQLLLEQGHGRKTFSFESENGKPKIYIHKTLLSRNETYQLNSHDVWKKIGKEIMVSEVGKKSAKYLAFLSSTLYDNTAKVQPKSHHEAQNMVKGNVALGGGGLALFGTGCFWAWPTTIDSVQKKIEDSSRIDSRVTLDDSNYRGTLGGCIATSLGSVLHELGHTLGLGHTSEGIMSRGFNDLDSFLSFKQLKILSKCNYNRQLGHIKHQNSENDSNFFFTKSCALTLAHNLWIRSPGETKLGCISEIYFKDKSFFGCCQMIILQWRGDNGIVLKTFFLKNRYCNQINIGMLKDNVKSLVVFFKMW